MEREWNGRRGEWRGSGMGGEGGGWAGERIRWGSGILGRFGRLKSLYYWLPLIQGIKADSDDSKGLQLWEVVVAGFLLRHFEP
jgi:hypothetical protein